MLNVDSGAEDSAALDANDAGRRIAKEFFMYPRTDPAGSNHLSSSAVQWLKSLPVLQVLKHDLRRYKALSFA